MTQSAALAGERPLAGTLDALIRERRLALAEWHLSEAILKLAAGDFEGEDYELEAAAEALSIATGRVVKKSDAETLRFELQKEIDG